MKILKISCCVFIFLSCFFAACDQNTDELKTVQLKTELELPTPDAAFFETLSAELGVDFGPRIENRDPAWTGCSAYTVCWESCLLEYQAEIETAALNLQLYYLQILGIEIDYDVAYDYVVTFYSPCSGQCEDACCKTCPQGFTHDTANCNAQIPIEGYEWFVFENAFYVHADCSISTANDCCPPGMVHDGAHCIYPYWFTPEIYNPFEFEGSLYLQIIGCD